VAVLTAVGIAFNAYMPVMLAVMEVPGCLVGVVSGGAPAAPRDGLGGYMPDEAGHRHRSRSESDPAPPRGPARPEPRVPDERALEQELRALAGKDGASGMGGRANFCRWEGQGPALLARALPEVFLNPGWSSSSAESSSPRQWPADRKSLRTTTSSSSWHSRACCVCSCSRWALRRHGT